MQHTPVCEQNLTGSRNSDMYQFMGGIKIRDSAKQNSSVFIHSIRVIRVPVFFL